MATMHTLRLRTERIDPPRHPISIPVVLGGARTPTERMLVDFWAGRCDYRMDLTYEATYWRITAFQLTGAEVYALRHGNLTDADLCRAAGDQAWARHDLAMEESHAR